MPALGNKDDAAASTDTATASQIGLFKRLLQRVTSLIALFPAALTAGGNLKTAVQEALPAGTNTIGKIAIPNTLAAAIITVPSAANGVTIAARDGRTELTIKNLDTSISMWVGNDTNIANSNAASADGGLELKAGESCSFGGSMAVYVRAASGNPLASVTEVYYS